jgi:cytidine deaminase
MDYTFGPDERKRLLNQAKEIALNAHARYSGFRVGAAVLGEKQVYLGTNVENASYPLGLCAERSALAAAVAAGDRNIKAISIACIDAPPDGPREGLFPCGACRQWLAELAPSAVVLIQGIDDRDFTVQELLPFAFQLTHG